MIAHVIGGVSFCDGARPKLDPVTIAELSALIKHGSLLEEDIKGGGRLLACILIDYDILCPVGGALAVDHGDVICLRGLRPIKMYLLSECT